MQKRNDLQGIRGLAITSVLLFHFFPSIFKNGYVGVDQFFILSGFLMAKIVSREEYLSGTVLYNFYYRRLKRILPLYILFIFCTLLISFELFSVSMFTYNIPQAIRSLFFISNTQQEDETQTYEKMLAEAENLFTHTWSLSCEVQFYLMAPFLILPPFLLPKNNVAISLCIFSYVSSIYYFMNGYEYFAFNSVFMRIWQFSLGILCSHFLKSKKEDPLLPSDFRNSGESFSTNILLLSVVILSWYPTEISNHLVRLLICLQTSCLIYCGHSSQSLLLSNKLIVYIGDISYSLYLVHWPVYVYLKQNNMDSIFGSITGILISTLLAVLIYESYEKYYLKLEKKSIVTLVALLYLSCFVLLVPYIDFVPTKLDVGGSSELEYFVLPDNLTLDAVMKLNTQFSKIDISLLQLKECNYTQFHEKETTERWKMCQVNNSLFSGDHRIMFLGNSYAPMMTRLFIKLKECKEKAKDVFIYGKAACEVLNDSPYSHCKGVTQKFYNAVKEVQPEVLFISTRLTTAMVYPPKNGSIDKVFEQEKMYLQRLEEFVTIKKIYILTAYPLPVLTKYSSILNKALENGDPVEHKDLTAKDNFQLARDRMVRLAAQCTKCELIDVMQSLIKEGIFQMYNEDTKVGYFTDPQHFNDYGLQKISPVYRNICTKL